MTYRTADESAPLAALSAGLHTWCVAIRGDVPLFFGRAKPVTVEARSWVAARALAEMLPEFRETPRECLCVTWKGARK